MKKKKLIAIDFDGTIIEQEDIYSRASVTGRYMLISGAVEGIKELYEAGYELALWTCRERYWLEDAKKILEKEGLFEYFTYFNADGEDVTRKIKADFYIDNASITGNIDWAYIVEWIKEKV